VYSKHENIPPSGSAKQPSHQNKNRSEIWKRLKMESNERVREYRCIQCKLIMANHTLEQINQHRDQCSLTRINPPRKLPPGFKAKRLMRVETKPIERVLVEVKKKEKKTSLYHQLKKTKNERDHFEREVKRLKAQVLKLKEQLQQASQSQCQEKKSPLPECTSDKGPSR
jgi:hypothetical protein